MKYKRTTIRDTYPNATISDADGDLRATAAEINELIKGGSDYAGGIRYAVYYTVTILRKQAQKAAQEQVK